MCCGESSADNIGIASLVADNRGRMVASLLPQPAVSLRYLRTCCSVVSRTALVVLFSLYLTTMVQESTTLCFHVFYFYWSANKIVGFLLTASVFVAGVGSIVSFCFPLVVLLAAAVVLLISFGFALRGSTCSNSLPVAPLDLLLLFFWLPCV